VVPAAESGGPSINYDAVGFETRSEYAPIIWGLLCAETRVAFQNGLAPGRRLSLAASWICEVQVRRYPKESSQTVANE
jgi:hypothetical protein